MTDLEYINIQYCNRFLLQNLRKARIHLLCDAAILKEYGNQREAQAAIAAANDCKKAELMATRP